MDIKLGIEKIILQLLSEMGITETAIIISPSSDPIHGEYTTNIAMKVSKKLGKLPMAVAEEIRGKGE